MEVHSSCGEWEKPQIDIKERLLLSLQVQFLRFSSSLGIFDERGLEVF